MDGLLPGLWSPDLFDGISWLVLAGGVLAAILATGRAIGRRLQLQLWGIPEALVAGVLGLLVAPKGPFPLLPEHHQQAADQGRGEQSHRRQGEPEVLAALESHGGIARPHGRGGAMAAFKGHLDYCLLYTSPSPRDGLLSRMPSSA